VNNKKNFDFLADCCGVLFKKKFFAAVIFLPNVAEIHQISAPSNHVNIKNIHFDSFFDSFHAYSMLENTH
jgi:hypothetical protein